MYNIGVLKGVNYFLNTLLTTLKGSCIDKKHHFAITLGYNFII